MWEIHVNPITVQYLIICKRLLDVPFFLVCDEAFALDEHLMK